MNFGMSCVGGARFDMLHAFVIDVAFEIGEEMLIVIQLHERITILSKLSAKGWTN